MARHVTGAAEVVPLFHGTESKGDVVDDGFTGVGVDSIPSVERLL